MSNIKAIEAASRLKFQLDDPERAAVNEMRSPDEQQALDEFLYDPAAIGPELLPEQERNDSKTPLRRGDDRCSYAHALDNALRNSKVVKTDRGAVLATPNAGSRLLTPYDPANQLPQNAKILKLGEGWYRVQIPNRNGAYDEITGESVVALIAEALHHLHG